MANRSLKTKKKLKTTLGKAPTDKENTKDGDISNLWKPIETSIYGLRHALSLFETATDEVRRLLMYECDLIYECRMCRNLYRSLANFILHKRSYCCDRYKNNPEKNFFRESTDYVISYDQENGDDDEQTDVPEKRKLNTVLERLDKRREAALMVENLINAEEKDNEEEEEETQSNEEADEKNLKLEKIKDSEAVFQTVTRNLRSMGKESGMKSEVMEIHSILDKNEVILSKDGKAINFSSGDNHLVCMICNQKFVTKKTLSSHFKVKHTISKVVYPCPTCKDVFASSWSVFRHLYKVHRKTAAQVKRLRHQIQPKVCSKDQYLNQNKKKSVQTPEDEENEWMENFETDNDLQMCGGCGKRFERKAALHSHSALCSKRIAICNTLSVNKLKRNTPTDGATQENATQVNQARGAARRKPNILLRRRVAVEKSADDSGNEAKNEDEVEETKKETETQPEEATESSSNGQKCLENEEDVTKIDEKQCTPSRRALKVSAEAMDSPGSSLVPLEQDELYKIIGISVSSDKCTEESKEKSNDIQTDKDDAYFQDYRDEEVVEVEAEEIAEEEDDEEEEELKALFADEVDKPDVQPHSSDILDAITNSSFEDNSLPESAAEETTVQRNGDAITCDYDDSGNSSRKRKLSDSDCRSSCDDDTTKLRRFNALDATFDDDKPQQQQQTDYENLDEKMQPFVNVERLSCKRCEWTFSNLEELRGHMAMHFNWYRFRCNLCPFKSYQKMQTFTHVHKKHQIRELELIKDVVFDIPEWESAELCSGTFLEIVSQPALFIDLDDSGNEEEILIGCNDVSVEKEVLSSGIEEEVIGSAETGYVLSNNSIDLPQEEVEHGCSYMKSKRSSIECSEEDEDNEGKLPDERQDPETIKMVMEVIFGSASHSSTAITESKKADAVPSGLDRVISPIELSSSSAESNSDSSLSFSSKDQPCFSPVVANSFERSSPISADLDFQPNFLASPTEKIGSSPEVTSSKEQSHLDSSKEVEIFSSPEEACFVEESSAEPPGMLCLSKEEVCSVPEVGISSKESSTSPVDQYPSNSRPVRQRTPFVHKDFLYDMSSLLKGKVSKDVTSAQNKVNSLARKGAQKFCAKINRDIDNNVQFPAVPKIRLRKCEDLYVRCEEDTET